MKKKQIQIRMHQNLPIQMNFDISNTDIPNTMDILIFFTYFTLDISNTRIVKFLNSAPSSSK